MQIAVEHITRYRYAEPATYSVQALRLTPASFAGHRVITWSVTGGADDELTQSRDGCGNTMYLLTVHRPHEELVVRAAGVVDVIDKAGVVQGLNEIVPPRVFLRRTPLTAPTPEIAALGGGEIGADRIAWLHALMAEIRGRVDYEKGTTHAATTAAEAFAAGKGVCQDHAHIFIAAARGVGVPARYVTGYLLTDGTQDIAHHAWAETWIDGVGWIGFDVANDICPTDRYVRIASHLDAEAAAPIRGARRGGGAETLEVEVHVMPTAAKQSQSAGLQTQAQSQASKAGAQQQKQGQ
jgi:transglutaminase-like putative cysteine protease